MDFAFKIDRHVKANLYKICRLCGIENPDMIKILKTASENQEDEDEPELSAKILICLGIEVTARDKMPQSCCSLCSDKIDDFYEFREMCYATNAQTRKLLGLRELKPKAEPKQKPEAKPEIKVPVKEDTPPPPPSPDPPSPLLPMSTRKRKNAAVVVEKEEEIVIPNKQPKKDIKLVKEKEAPTPPGKPIKEIKVVLKDMKGIKISSKDNIQNKGASKDNKDTKNSKEKLGSSGSKDKSTKDSHKDKKFKELRLSRSTLTRSPSPIPIKRVTRRDAEKNKFEELEPVPGPSEKSNKKTKEKEIKEEIKEEETSEKKVTEKKLTEKRVVEKKVTEKKEIPAEKKAPATKKLNFKCKICPDCFPSSVLLTGHCKEKHLPIIWRYHCFYCYEPLQKNVDIKNHNLWHRLSKTPFQCASCREEFSTAYNLSKHSKECAPFIPIIDPRKVLPDSTCLECKNIFLTPYLFNIHDCVLKKQNCPGCQLHIPQVDKFLVHVAICDKTTRYLPDDMVLNTAIKQEPTQSAPMVVLETNQCVAIPAAQVTRGKKSNKSMKSTLQRVSELLNSTFSQLESIKQEPSATEQVENEVMSEDDGNQDNFAHDDHFGDASSHEEDNTNEDIDIKPEMIENTSIDPVPLPILKLKIKMEHGKLNSSIVDSPDSPSRVQSPVKSFSPQKVSSPVESTEKKKNKKNKKRKLIDEDPSVSMPVPGAIRIKKEKMDTGYEEKEKGLKVSIVQSGLNQHDFKQEEKSDEEMEEIKSVDAENVEINIKLEENEENCDDKEKKSNLTLKISSVQSGVFIKEETNNESYEDDSELPVPIMVKTEPDEEQSSIMDVKQEPTYDQESVEDEVDESVEDEVDESVEDEVDDDLEENYEEVLHKSNEEEYIKSIDFNNIVIKQEKGLEIDDIFEEVDKDDEAIVDIEVGEIADSSEELDSDEKCLVLEPQKEPPIDDDNNVNEESNGGEENKVINSEQNINSNISIELEHNAKELDFESNKEQVIEDENNGDESTTEDVLEANNENQINAVVKVEVSQSNEDYADIGCAFESQTKDQYESVQIKQEKGEDEVQNNISVSKPQSIPPDEFFKETEITESPVLAVRHATTISPEEFNLSSDENRGIDMLSIHKETDYTDNNLEEGYHGPTHKEQSSDVETSENQLEASSSNLSSQHISENSHKNKTFEVEQPMDGELKETSDCSERLLENVPKDLSDETLQCNSDKIIRIESITESSEASTECSKDNDNSEGILISKVQVNTYDTTVESAAVCSESISLNSEAFPLNLVLNENVESKNAEENFGPAYNLQVTPFASTDVEAAQSGEDTVVSALKSNDQCGEETVVTASKSNDQCDKEIVVTASKSNNQSGEETVVSDLKSNDQSGHGTLINEELVGNNSLGIPAYTSFESQENASSVDDLQVTHSTDNDNIHTILEPNVQGNEGTLYNKDPIEGNDSVIPTRTSCESQEKENVSSGDDLPVTQVEENVSLVDDSQITLSTDTDDVNTLSINTDAVDNVLESNEPLNENTLFNKVPIEDNSLEISAQVSCESQKNDYLIDDSMQATNIDEVNDALESNETRSEDNLFDKESIEDNCLGISAQGSCESQNNVNSIDNMEAKPSPIIDVQPVIESNEQSTEDILVNKEPIENNCLGILAHGSCESQKNLYSIDSMEATPSTMIDIQPVIESNEQSTEEGPNEDNCLGISVHGSCESQENVYSIDSMQGTPSSMIDFQPVIESNEQSTEDLLVNKEPAESNRPGFSGITSSEFEIGSNHANVTNYSVLNQQENVDQSNVIINTFEVQESNEQMEPLNYSTGHKTYGCSPPGYSESVHVCQDNGNEMNTQQNHFKNEEQSSLSAQLASNFQYNGDNVTTTTSELNESQGTSVESTQLNVGHSPDQENDSPPIISDSLRIPTEDQTYPSQNAIDNTNPQQASETTENQLNETIEENQLNENNLAAMDDNTNEIAENHNNENLEKELLGADVS